MDFISSFFTDYTLRTVALGAVLLGAVAGILGSFALLRRQSLLGDAVSHAALPGVVLAFLITRSKAPLVLLLGALAAGALGVLVLQFLSRRTRLNQDTVLGLILSVFFGVGMMLLTFTQKLPDARQAGLSKFLFGQAATLLESDVLVMFSLGGLAVLMVLLLWKEFKVVSFDAEYAASLGFPVGKINLLLNALLVIAIVIGLQAVGVVLMSALIVAPAAAARQWTDRLEIMVVLAAGFGALSGLSGVMISAAAPRLATGPTIVLTASLIVLISLFFSPRRGLIVAFVRRLQRSRRFESEILLVDLLRVARQHDHLQRAHSEKALAAVVRQPAGIHQGLRQLQRQNLVAQDAEMRWRLTAEGVAAAQQSENQFGETNHEPITN